MPTTHDALAEDERRKYVKMWGVPSYRQNSPGLNIAPRVFEMVGMRAGESVTDYGCGEAKARNWFRGQGMIARGVDIVPLSSGVVEAALWDLPSHLPGSNYAFCADVMEHIPPGKVDAVLSGIRSHTLGCAAFTIATVPCTQGQRAGETLHLTIESRDWWEAKLREFWRTVEHRDTDRDWRHLFLAWP